MAKRKVTCSLYVPAAHDMSQCLSMVRAEKHFSSVVVPLVHPGFTREDILHCKDRPLSRSCRILESNDFFEDVIGEISRHIDVDSFDENVRKRSEKLLQQELEYAVHLSCKAVVIRLRSERCSNLARIISSWLPQTRFFILIQVPIDNPENGLNANRSDVNPLTENQSPWEWWNRFRLMCDQHKYLGVVLELTADMPGVVDRARWLAEPVRAIFVKTSLFLTNRLNYPVLSSVHNKYLREFASLGIHPILCGPAAQIRDLTNYANYLIYILRSVRDCGDGIENDDSVNDTFADQLQNPLQPLMNNLDAATYEVFEKDPVKYRIYGEAIAQALLDRVSEENKDSVVTVIMVMGAGRGPIVQCALDAADRANRKVRVYAIEKNPNAVITLQCRRDDEWQGRVTVIVGDMRHLELNEKADILVSELLGSFGDNELSPECLDGAQKFLKDDGISIPSEYTSYIVPMMSQKLYSEAKSVLAEPGKPAYSTLETPWVVLLKNKLYLDEPAALFTFSHPNKAKRIDNNRYGIKSFTIMTDCLVHGFAGFFHATLYQQHVLSIVPESFSKGMFSWFPIYFPILRPISIIAGQQLTAHFWRCVTDRDVWYEWTISLPESLPVHNVGGRSYKIGL